MEQLEQNIILKMIVSGAKIVEKRNEKSNEIEETYTQFQAMEDFINKNGDEDIRLHTLKINQVLSDKEQKDLLGKSITTDASMNLKEHIFDYSKAYSCNSFLILDKGLKDSFLVNNTIKGVIKSVSIAERINKETKEITYSTVFKIVSFIENQSKITQIKVNEKLSNYKDYKGKEVLFQSLKISIFNNKKYISTDLIPKVV